jgi:hypothetical protein
MATFAAVLDACVLFPAYLRDLLLRLGETGLYRPLMTPAILEELRRNLVRTGRCTETSASSLIAAISGAFADDVFEPSPARIMAMNNHPKDRHFPPESLAAWEIEAKAPDDFLVDLFWLAPGLVAQVVAEQAAAYRAPSLTVEELAVALRAIAPNFAGHLASFLAGDPPL